MREGTAAWIAERLADDKAASGRLLREHFNRMIKLFFRAKILYRIIHPKTNPVPPCS
jgi:hypothetical protein